MFSALLLPSCVPVIFRDMNNYILTEGRNLKTIAWVSCCLFAKKTVEHGIEHDI